MERWEALTNNFEDGITRDDVESVCEIDLKQSKGRLLSVNVNKATNTVYYDFVSPAHSDAKLHGLQMCLGLCGDRHHEDRADKVT